MGTYATVVCEILTCSHLEVNQFNKLSELFSYGLVEYFLKQYIRFLNERKKVLMFHHYRN